MARHLKGRLGVGGSDGRDCARIEERLQAPREGARDNRLRGLTCSTNTCCARGALMVRIAPPCRSAFRHLVYRGTSLIRNRLPLGPP